MLTFPLSFWKNALLPPGYFGNIQSDGSPTVGYSIGFFGAETWYNNGAVTVYTCPGTGARTISSLGIWAKTRGSPHGSVRVALYETALDIHYVPQVTLICQWSSSILVNSATEQWWESSSLTGSTTIYGGSNYIIAVTFSSALTSLGYTSATNATKAIATDYTAGFPDPIGAGSGNTTRPTVRAYVTGGYGTGSHPPGPTMEVFYVDPSAVGSTEDGTTGNPYLSLNAALAGRCNKTFTLPIQIRCRTSGSVADTTRVTDGALGQMVTSASNYLQITAEAGSRAGTSWDTTKYTLSAPWTHTTGAGVSLAPTHGYIFIDGIQITVSSQAGQDTACEIVYWSQGQTGAMTNCIIKGTNDSVTTQPTRGVSSINGVNLINTIIYNLGAGTQTVGVKNHGNSNFYNCTILAESGQYALDITDGSVSVAKNCYLRGAVASFAVGVAGASLTQTTVATADALSTTVALRNIAANTTNFTNVTLGSEDWSLPSGSALRNVGTDTSGEAAPFNFTTDINGATRTVPWDVGADEF